MVSDDNDDNDNTWWWWAMMMIKSDEHCSNTCLSCLMFCDIYLIKILKIRFKYSQPFNILTCTQTFFNTISCSSDISKYHLKFFLLVDTVFLKKVKRGLCEDYVFKRTRIAERRFLTGLQRGYLFWGEGAAIHTQATIKPCRQPLHATEPHVRLKHKLIQNIVPFWKTFVTQKKEYHF